jgi:teichoic acid glycerol-phosphate primase
MIVVIVDFEEDINEFFSYIEREKRLSNYRIIVFHHPRICGKLKVIKNVTYIEKNAKSKLKMIRTMQQALFIIVDNYVVELGAIKLNPSKVCIQIWHANGALKKFGLASAHPYSQQDIGRFTSVYKQYDKILVGSEKMKSLFKDAFRIENDEIFMECGTLRTDKYFKQIAISGHLENALSVKNRKKILLYAPTYREGQNELKLKSTEMNKLKAEGYTLIIRTHPAIKSLIPDELKDFVVDGNDFQLHELLTLSDLLITDYSSIAMEFSILSKPIYFYCYDLDEYRERTGLISEFEKQVCSRIYKDTRALEEAILKDVVKAKDVQLFNEKWNKYTTGSACESLLSYVELRNKNYEISN